MIEQALAEARSELETLDTRRRGELMHQIERAEAVVAGSPAKATGDGTAPLTLHKALVRVIEDSGNEGMTARELADAIDPSWPLPKARRQPGRGQPDPRTHEQLRRSLREERLEDPAARRAQP